MSFSPSYSSVVTSLVLAFTVFCWSLIPPHSKLGIYLRLAVVFFPSSTTYQDAWAVHFEASSFEYTTPTINSVHFRERFENGVYDYLKETPAFKVYSRRCNNRLPSAGQDWLWDAVITDCIRIITEADKQQSMTIKDDIPAHDLC
ncbi:hypothetical protein K435DRAFT_870602 [Dendrothele bispora CBS 962.96]|uniref:Uncharacterized protein n=1 Tax=Dendrothele bispora (strain CBS 962.96) TaxID=1314807 RepID=A0A4S8L658_DENBC|nr:hypothetical protein K435DRAFT_870602 [Dendrothele bispora CBS 962.96]